MFGHALEGNLHFVFTQDFGSASEIDRYRRFMDAVCTWSSAATTARSRPSTAPAATWRRSSSWSGARRPTTLMREIKQHVRSRRACSTPASSSTTIREVHLKNLKPLPAADPIVDKCMECGFCERMCPSQGMTFTPRHRIIGWREISRLRAEGDEAGAAVMSASYDYQGLETCAACGLCAIACPVDIETGILTKKIRGERKGPLARRIADLIADQLRTGARRYPPGPPARRSHRPGARRGEAGKRLAHRASPERRPGAGVDAGDADGGVVPAARTAPAPIRRLPPWCICRAARRAPWGRRAAIRSSSHSRPRPRRCCARRAIGWSIRRT